MKVIDVYKQYFAATCKYQQVERNGALLSLTATSDSGTIKYERSPDGGTALAALLQAHPREVRRGRRSSDAGRYAARMQAYLLLQHGKERNEPQDASVSHGAFGCEHHPEQNRP